MKDAGFTDYSAFIKAIYSAIDRHAREKEWLPVYWNLGDEPIGDELKASIENATAYREAFPEGAAVLHRRHQPLQARYQRSAFRARQDAARGHAEPA